MSDNGEGEPIRIPENLTPEEKALWNRERIARDRQIELAKEINPDKKYPRHHPKEYDSPSTKTFKPAKSAHTEDDYSEESNP